MASVASTGSTQISDWPGSPLSTLHRLTVETPEPSDHDEKATMTGTIVVGVSGSPASVAALRWAAGEAGQRKANLAVVLSWQHEPRAYYAVASEGHGDRSEEDARRELASILRATFGPKLPRRLTAVVVEGMPERTLVDQSSNAELLVLGCGASPEAGARSIGAVIRSCLSHARCPVVVIGAQGLSAHDQAVPPRRQFVPALAG